MATAMASIASLFVLLAVCLAAVNCRDAICGLENYDTATIRSRDYWSMNISSSQCATEAGNATCTVYFSLCQSLPHSLCNGVKDSGFCQQVIPHGDNKIHHYFSMGLNDNKVEKEDEGFVANYPNGTDKTDKCLGKSVTVLLLFTCNKTAFWDSTTSDVTQWLMDYHINEVNTCQVIVEVAYSGACVRKIPLIPGCNSLQHFDLMALRSQTMWVAKVPLDNCKSPFAVSRRGLTTSRRGVGDDATCDLMFSFCDALPSGVCYDSVFCQQGVFGNPISMGAYDHDLQIGHDADWTGFTISAYGGTKTDKCPGGLHSTLIFNCSVTANWTSVDISKYTKAQPDAEECEFAVIFQYNGACTAYRPSSKSKPSPVGGILIGIFFGVLILYFVIGAIVQVVRGKRGPEIIPNYKAWNTFFVLVLEGCQFSLDVITCFQCKGRNIATKSDYESL